MEKLIDVAIFKTLRKKSEPIGYQADNPLTIYYAKYIEKKPEVK